MKIANVLLLAMSSRVACFTVPNDETNLVQMQFLDISDDDEQPKPDPPFYFKNEEPPTLWDTIEADNNKLGNKQNPRSCKTKYQRSEQQNKQAVHQLCGLCLKRTIEKEGGLGRLGPCADHYCLAANCWKEACSGLNQGRCMGCLEPYLEGIAKFCAPEEVIEKVRTGEAAVPRGMLAIVANNPSKDKLQLWVKKHDRQIRISFSEFLTGTGTTGKMVNKVTGGAFDFPTLSGPKGGDAQLGGILAMQGLAERGDADYVSGLVFFNDESEPHVLDIWALKALAVGILGHAKSHGKFAENAGEADKVFGAIA